MQEAACECQIVSLHTVRVVRRRFTTVVPWYCTALCSWCITIISISRLETITWQRHWQGKNSQHTHWGDVQVDLWWQQVTSLNRQSSRRLNNQSPKSITNWSWNELRVHRQMQRRLCLPIAIPWCVLPLLSCCWLFGHSTQWEWHPQRLRDWTQHHQQRKPPWWCCKEVVRRWWCELQGSCSYSGTAGVSTLISCQSFFLRTLLKSTSFYNSFKSCGAKSVLVMISQGHNGSPNKAARAPERHCLPWATKGKSCKKALSPMEKRHSTFAWAAFHATSRSKQVSLCPCCGPRPTTRHSFFGCIFRCTHCIKQLQ